MSVHDQRSAAPAVRSDYSPREVRLVLLGLMAAMFTVLVSSSIVVNALPTIVPSLHGTQTAYTWMVTASLLANAVSTPVWGKLSDLLDKKLLVQTAIVVFVLGTVAGALAQNVGIMIAARAVQGVAAGGVLALLQSILGVMVPVRERGRYAGYTGAVLALSTSVGPLAGGLIVDSPLGWRWTFWLCLPIAVAALVTLQFTLRIAPSQRRGTVDWAGIALLATGVSLLLIWVSFVGRPGSFGWWSLPSALLVAGAGASLTALIVVEKRTASAILPIWLIRRRTVALALVASLPVGFGLFGATTLFSEYLQVGRGEDATAAGFALLPFIFGTLTGSLVTGRLITAYGRWRPYLIAGAAALTAGFAGMSITGAHAPFWQFATATALAGLGVGMQQQNLVLAVQNSVDPADVGVGSGTVAFIRALGGAIALAVFGSLLAAQSSASIAAVSNAHDAGGSAVELDRLGGLPEQVQAVVRSAYADSFALPFFVAACLSLLGLVAVLGMRHSALRSSMGAPTANGLPD